MLFRDLDESGLRDHCKRAVEGLERWLRRLIDEELTTQYGADYFDVTRKSGDRLVRSDIVKRVKDRANRHSPKLNRVIDAADLDDTIALICNPELFKEHSRKPLSDVFPNGYAEARTVLSRLVGPRNALSHARPIAVHDALRVLCYSQDIINSLKAHYQRNNMQEMYNVPTVIRVVDSIGYEVHLNESNRHRHGSAMVDHSEKPAAYLRCGDTITIQVDIDPSFDAQDYYVQWLIANVGGPVTIGHKFTLVLDEKYVSTRFCVCCRVITNASWHKLGQVDDQVDIAYRVLPPI